MLTGSILPAAQLLAHCFRMALFLGTDWLRNVTHSLKIALDLPHILYWFD